MKKLVSSLFPHRGRKCFLESEQTANRAFRGLPAFQCPLEVFRGRDGVHHRIQQPTVYSIKLKTVLEKRQLGQALNAKEFAVLTGISYSTSREWFHIQHFPAFNGVVFWEDFVMWRQQRTGIAHAPESRESEQTKPAQKDCNLHLPAKAQNLLSQA